MIANVDPASLSHTCDMGYAAPASLAFVIEDYIRRLHHHPGQILGGGGSRRARKVDAPDAGLSPDHCFFGKNPLY